MCIRLRVLSETYLVCTEETTFPLCTRFWRFSVFLAFRRLIRSLILLVLLHLPYTLRIGFPARRDIWQREPAERNNQLLLDQSAILLTICHLKRACPRPQSPLERAVHRGRFESQKCSVNPSYGRLSISPGSSGQRTYIRYASVRLAR